MAQTTKINALIGDLAASFAKVAGVSDAKKLKQSKEHAAKVAKGLQYVRTNQFEVESTLDGLIEKFSIINRDDLASALSKRLTELKVRSRSKWTPEILSLFLNLADRPDQKSNLEALELLKPPSLPPSPVTWAELDAEEPLKGEIWLDESYSSASEDELEAVSKLILEPKSQTKTAIEDLETPIVTDAVSRKDFLDLKSAQFWTQADLRSSRPQLLTELQVVREVLLMLHGLPTTIFAIDERNVLVFHATNVMLSQVSLSGLNDVLQSFASIGSDLLRMRTWAERSPAVPLLQCFNAAVCERLRVLDREIATIEQRLLQMQGQSIVVSILQVHQDIEILTRPISILKTITMSVPTSGTDFICLELMYDQLCSLQASGDDESFNIIGEIFFDCLNVYLRPVSSWMTNGTILENDESFFIAVADKGSPISSLWHERYSLRMTNDGSLYAPKFLHPAARKILNTGKSIVFLRHLRKDILEAEQTRFARLEFEEVVGRHRDMPLAPFSEVFASSFAKWMDSKYGPSSTILKQYLIDKCNLLQHIENQERIYFSKDGVLFQTFSDELFKRMGNRKGSWNDKFLLTELARRTFSSAGSIRAGSLSVRTTNAKVSTMHSTKVLASVVLDVALPWPVQNIVQRPTMQTYQAVFQFLLQVYYAIHLLRSVNFTQHGPNPSMSRQAIGIRQHLLWFANIMHSYVLETVVQSGIEKLRSDLVAAEDMDAMCELHEIFVKKLELTCLLSKNLTPIYDSIISILDLAIVFAGVQERHEKSLENASARSSRTKVIRRGRERRRSTEYLDSDDDLEDGPEPDGAVQGVGDESVNHEADISIEARVQSMHDKFAQLLHFTVAGLRSVSRAGGQVEWEMLAGRLEWGLDKRKRTLDYI